MRKSLSIIVIAGDEEANIGECLGSVAGWADEIVVVDSESRDRTVEIAKRYTPKIFVRLWEGFAKQKQFALDQATGDWILSLDADERVTPELKLDIETTLASESECAGYKINRRNFFLGKWIRSCFWYPDYQLRLFRKGSAKVTESKVHEGFIVDGKIGTLEGDLLHYSYRTLHDAFRKINNYSTLAAEERVGRKRVKAHDILLHSIAAFLNVFISRKGYRDGMHGFLVAILNAMTTLLMYTKIWEMQNVGGQAVSEKPASNR